MTGRTGFLTDRGAEPVRQLFVEGRGEGHAHREGGRVVGHPDAVTPVGKTQRRQPEVSHCGEIGTRERDLVRQAHLRDDVAARSTSAAAAWRGARS